MNCPMGVDYGALIRAQRSMLVAIGKIPPGLKATVDSHLRTGNNMAVSTEDFVETIQWMEEEVQQELHDATVKIPIDKKGAQVFYTMNPREPKFYPLTIQAMAKIFHVAKVDYTVSSTQWDATNYALFSGDDEAARTIVRRQIEAVEELGCQMLVAAECGHGFRAIRWEAENWLGRQARFKVVSAVEFMAGLIQKGLLHFDRHIIKERVTYHDPCDQCRSGGIINEPRYILHHVVNDFVEMQPHGIENFCCGGGGGALTMTEFAEHRLEAGRIKAEQIRATGARIVATSCHNCLDQLSELSRHYKLEVKAVNLCELMADALVVGS
jgi:Fe-S oxidoreductase